MRDPDDSLARTLAMAETPEERAEVGAAVAEYCAQRCRLHALPLNRRSAHPDVGDTE